MELREGMLLQLLHHDLNCLIQLRIVSLAIRGGIKIYFNVWSHAMILHFPLAFEAVNSGSRRGDVASVD